MAKALKMLRTKGALAPTTRSKDEPLAAPVPQFRRTHWYPADFWSPRRLSGTRSASHETLAISAPGRNRTCDLRFRKPLLYPLSYGGNVLELLYFSSGTSPSIPHPTGLLPTCYPDEAASLSIAARRSSGVTCA
jgi:hypothetical protein